MKKGLKTGSVLKTGVAALALCMLTGNAWAAASCARPQDVTALQVAALQQQLMVAAFSCNNAADYNRFVISHRRELQESDRALMGFFLRQDADKGTDNYNAYKTGLANDSSLRSARDPRFCRSAKAAFDDAFKHEGSVAELVSQRPSLARTGYASCAPSAQEGVLMADATPSLPARHRALPDSQPSDLAPDLTSRMDRALPPISPHRDEGRVVPPREYDPRYAQQHSVLEDRDADNGNANGPDVDAPGADDRGAGERGDFDRYRAETKNIPDDVDDAPRHGRDYADTRSRPPRTYGRDHDGYGDGTPNNYPNRDGYENGPAANNAPSDDRDAYDAPDGSARYGYGPYTYGPWAHRPDAYQPYAYRPPARPRFVRGPDGRWYLLLPSRR